MAGGAGRQILARAVTARTLQVELHPSASLRDLPGPVAFRAFSRSLEESLTVTVRANVLPRDIQAQDTAANRGPERHVDLVFQIASRFGACLRGSPRALAAAEDRSEDVAEASTAAAPAPAVRTVDKVGEIEPAEIEGDPLAAICCSAAGEAAGRSAARTAAVAR